MKLLRKIKTDKKPVSHPKVRKTFKRFTIAILGLFFLFMPVAFLMYISLLVGLYHKDMRAALKNLLTRKRKSKYVIRSVEGNKMVIVREDVAKKAKKEGVDSVLPDISQQYYVSCGHPVESHGPKAEDCPDWGKQEK